MSSWGGAGLTSRSRSLVDERTKVDDGKVIVEISFNKYLVEKIILRVLVYAIAIREGLQLLPSG